ncbi:hypothetical protein AN3482.2 [Aspergillus nidulans FGSC A4]|uniref:Mid2 domain-containing protein n=1 Tax=Emericella nidulans (strain FGSC A4 / ATCC 38163 / CBS 112.46 / NRRL 194 / M139) TaxID=227321 RepID=Q5B7J8_EMENI|nr:hypothetical protein [Aspergillus nidulans FGSC A4]EAA59043.1 hypothetical protein AN3482.2 [Aspergillus nidulans FGSC A4]CBF76064.1 TPA: hypothetical protein ANIA_03482 [Aspergillus nidulans FGSC A4]|eukprot:XP_661086.1 hypothetical protein AN3482.2 [Aspergillus nidulans FGSC A4]
MSQAVPAETASTSTRTENHTTTTDKEESSSTTETTYPTTTTIEILTGTTTTTITITGTPKPYTTSTGTSSTTSDTSTDGDPTPQATVTIYSPLPTSNRSGNSLTTGAKAGIGIGVALGVLLVILGAMIFLRRYRGSAKGGNTGRSELDSAPISESANKTDSPVEMEATERRVFELPTKSGLAESGANWQYAIDPTSVAIHQDYNRDGQLRNPIWAQNATPVALFADAWLVPWEENLGNAPVSPKYPNVTGSPSKIRLIPYGSTKLHIADFPIAVQSS